MTTGRELYPLTKSFAFRGFVFGLLAAVILGNLAIGFAMWCFVATAGLLWRSDHLPIMSFCIGYQWLFVVLGYTIYLWTGEFPGQRFLGDIQKAVFYSSLGLLFLAFGVRLTSRKVGVVGRVAPHGNYNIDRLFWLVIVLFMLDWMVELNLLGLPSQILHPVRILLKLRYLFLFLMLIEVHRNRQGYRIAALAFTIAIVPKLLTGMSSFKEPLFFLGILMLGRYVAHARTVSERRTNRRIIAIGALLATFLLAIGLVWNQDLKVKWRMALWSGEIAGSPIDKLAAFGGMLSDSLERFDSDTATESLGSRMSSGVAYFSHVLDRVPAMLDHEYGLFVGRGVSHVLTPRFLFPDKRDLGGDSWIVRKYAGLSVSGDEQGTSVGLGYLGEFYIDFGFFGIVALSFLFGAYFGLLYKYIYYIAPSQQIGSAFSIVLMLDYFTGYESNFAKLLGGMTQMVLIYSFVMFTVGRALHNYLSGSKERREAATIG
ncbi:MAG: hypothetical protein DHS20C11_16650 [Lysobacteraceae bacterium]|nr:MAG: hypothetical protein DHS20C11_16650 [Xanthomonadaceae bacterium]